MPRRPILRSDACPRTGTRARRLAGSFALALLGAATTIRAQAPAAPERVASVEGITEYRLANGLRVLLFPDAVASRRSR